MASVEIRNAVKKYGEVQVIHGVDIDVGDGEFVVLVGPSGCGKSTLLRMIAGLEEISGGTISIADEVVNDLEPKERNIAMVFQNYALYPHMTVAENMGFSLRLSRVSKDEAKAKVENAADILGLGALLDRYPGQLSGGQRQRVAMGRAIVRDPKVFLFDEPLSNLDAKLRVQMRAEIKALHRRLKTTTVYVTHDQVEAMTMADRIVIMRDGHIQQIGTPLELYDNPQSMFVAGFIGSPSINFIPGTLKDGTFHGIGGLSFASDGPEGDAVAAIRPNKLGLSPGGSEWDVLEVEPTGAETMLMLQAGEVQITISVSDRTTLEPGDKTGLSALPGDVMLFDPKTEKRIL
ncbi:ABC transporter ATP-binding protein [Oceaniglobus trochenteri]|uniref:ABC transporter ATP-binding protein n=1 Tax=Oceaniglobus trochenteri TaxID=2763260 RepID=UPI001CFFB842|nr:sn-glycerol-3-phosphate ABC transporter ATP-binding protein UgpC [Oceaniglobus trochenteri]